MAAPAMEENLALFTAFMKSYNAFMARDLNQTSMVYAELDQIHPEDVDEMDVTLQMSMAMCFNSPEKGHFSKECNKPKMEKSVDPNVASSSASENGKALVAQESGGYSWSDQLQALSLEEPHAFMPDIANSVTSEVHLNFCSQSCIDKVE
ncbi:hypothetical protein R6Q57_008565 [Mikania cordata]